MADKASVSRETLERLLDAFNAHDIDAVMSFFADDCVLEMPRGPDPWGRRMEGRHQVRQGLASRFAGIPDVHYGDDRHWIAGDRGCSEWLLTGTTGDGARVAVRGCDLFEFRGDKIIRKDSYWKIVEPTRAEAAPQGPIPAQGDMRLVTLQIEHPITDLGSWLGAFARFEQARASAGVRSQAIHQPVDDDKYIYIRLEFDSVEQAEAFKHFLETKVWSSQDASPGLGGTPRARILTSVSTGAAGM